MPDRKPDDPTEIDPADAARRIEDAGVADETAAYVNGGDTATPAEPDSDAKPDTDAEAHPS